MKPFAFPLTDGRIRVRLLEKADLEMIRVWRNRDEIRSAFLYSDQVTPEQQLRWWESYSAAENDWHYIFEYLDAELGPRPAGTYAIYSHDPAARTAEYGRMITGEEWARGKGFARSASRLLIDYGFIHLGLQSIHAEVLVENEPALRLDKSVGFREVGPGEHSGTIALRIDRDTYEAMPETPPLPPGCCPFSDFWRDVVGTWQPGRAAGPAVTLILVVDPGEDSNALRAITSLRDQDYRDFEVLVLDNTGSGRAADAVAEAVSDDSRFVHVRFNVARASRVVRIDQGVMLSRGRFVGMISPTHEILSVGAMVKDAEEAGADLVTRPGCMLAKWRVFLTIGFFDPDPTAAACYEYDLWQRAVQAGLTCVDHGAWPATPRLSPEAQQHLARDRNAALSLASLYQYPVPLPRR